MDPLESLQLARSQILANIVALTAQPKPTVSIDGKSVAWESLMDSYIKALSDLDEVISRAAGPVWIVTQATA